MLNTKNVNVLTKFLHYVHTLHEQKYVDAWPGLLHIQF